MRSYLKQCSIAAIIAYWSPQVPLEVLFSANDAVSNPIHHFSLLRWFVTPCRPSQSRHSSSSQIILHTVHPSPSACLPRDAQKRVYFIIQLSSTLRKLSAGLSSICPILRRGVSCIFSLISSSATQSYTTDMEYSSDPTVFMFTSYIFRES